MEFYISPQSGQFYMINVLENQWLSVTCTSPVASAMVLPPGVTIGELISLPALICHGDA